MSESDRAEAGVSGEEGRWGCCPEADVVGGGVMRVPVPGEAAAAGTVVVVGLKQWTIRAWYLSPLNST